MNVPKLFLLITFLPLAACASVEQQTTVGTAAVEGAAVGAVIGRQSNNTLGGAVLGGIMAATTAAVLSQPQTSAQPMFVQQPDAEE